MTSLRLPYQNLTKICWAQVQTLRGSEQIIPETFSHITLILTEVDDVPLVHVLDALADLAHVVDDLGLGHDVALRGDLLEELPARQAGTDSGH